MFQQVLRIYPPGYDRRARMEQTDVDRAMEVLDVQVSAEGACIYGGVQSIRRRLDALLDDLLPPDSQPGFGERLLRWAGLTARARAADAALLALFHDDPPHPGCTALCWMKGAQTFGDGAGTFEECISPEKGIRECIVYALDDAYCMMLPHEAARRAELHRAFWAGFGSGAEGGRMAVRTDYMAKGPVGQPQVDPE